MNAGTPVDPFGGTFIDEFLVCPVCKGRLDASPALMRCTICGLRFPQPLRGCFNLLPEDLLREGWVGWEERQRDMEQWYRDLLSRPGAAGPCFARDYAPFAGLLKTVSGDILDLGGGTGVTRNYLPPGARYVVIDPSLDWLDPGWDALTERFPLQGTRPCFVRGVGEHLPFPAGRFDAALAFWSLNHVSRPKQVFREVQRVLRPGGRFIAVLENMEPSWRDLATRRFLATGGDYLARALATAPSWRGLADRKLLVKGGVYFARTLAKKLGASLGVRPWPLQTDHIRIREAEIRKWNAPCLIVTDRAWLGQYLTYQFQRAASELET